MKRLLTLIACIGLAGTAYAAGPGYGAGNPDCPRWQNAQMQNARMQNQPPAAGYRQGMRGPNVQMQRQSMTFEQLDLNKDGKIDAEEFEQHRANRPQWAPEN